MGQGNMGDDANTAGWMSCEELAQEREETSLPIHAGAEIEESDLPY